MKRKVIQLAFVLLSTFSFQSNAQWTAATGLDGMTVTDIDVDNVTSIKTGGYTIMNMGLSDTIQFHWIFLRLGQGNGIVSSQQFCSGSLCCQLTTKRRSNRV